MHSRTIVLVEEFDELILAPPTRKNSYGIFFGGSSLKMALRHAAATSREPPLVVWSLPAPSMSTPNVCHFATHSSFHGSFPLPSNGEMAPEWPQPRAHATRSGRQR